MTRVGSLIEGDDQRIGINKVNAGKAHLANLKCKRLTKRRHKMEIPFIDGDEMDALTQVKRWYMWKSGERKRIKNKYRRRCRQVVRAQILKEM